MRQLRFKIKDPFKGSVDETEVEGESILIGRGSECQVLLPHKSVSRHHAEVTCSADGTVHVMDLRSREGVTLNGKPISGRSQVSPKDVIGIGDYRLRVKAKVRAGEPSGRVPAQPQPKGTPSPPRSPSARSRRPTGAAVDLDLEDALEEQAAQAATAVAEPEDFPSHEASGAGDEGEQAAAEPKRKVKDIWGEDAEFGYLLEFLSPIRPFLLDPDVSEIMVNGPGQVFIEKGGRLHLTGAQFPSDMALVSVVQNIAQSVGRTVDKRNPILDARLPDGSRVNAVVQPCARRGTYIAIRKFFTEKLNIQRLIDFNAVTPHAAEFIQACVRGMLNVIVTGGTGSGKTTLLNIVSDYIPDNERIIVIEDASELQLSQTHLVPMETRHADPRTGKGQVTIRDLLRTSLRLRPDRIVIGELRGEEAFDLLQAFNTGHRGSMTTIHSNSPRDCLNRLEMLVTLAGLDVPLRAIREQIASAVDIVIYTSRLHDGSRKITHVTEVLHLTENGEYRTNDIFKFKVSHIDPDGKIHGALEPTGNKPDIIMEYFENEGISFPPGFFTQDYAPGQLTFR